jgi:hypothetical protein
MKKINLYQFAFLIFLFSCETRQWDMNHAIGWEKERMHLSTHFRILHTALDDRNIQEIADSLESSYPRITAHLQSGELPIVDVFLYKDATALNKANPGIPIWAIGLATSVSQIHIISPNNPDHDYQTMIRNTVHEFVHCVSMKINSTISNNPRWLWESIALYEANLPWDPHMLAYLVNQHPPTLTELNDIANTRIYEVGYFIAQYIVDTHGSSKLRALIENNGNLNATLNMAEEEFTRQWFSFLKKKYGI